MKAQNALSGLLKHSESLDARRRARREACTEGKGLVNPQTNYRGEGLCASLICTLVGSKLLINHWIVRDMKTDVRARMSHRFGPTLPPPTPSPHPRQWGWPKP